MPDVVPLHRRLALDRVRLHRGPVRIAELDADAVRDADVLADSDAVDLLVSDALLDGEPDNDSDAFNNADDGAVRERHLPLRKRWLLGVRRWRRLRLGLGRLRADVSPGRARRHGLLPVVL